MSPGCSAARALIESLAFGGWADRNAVAKVLGIAVSVVLAAALTRYVELPMIDHGRQRRAAGASGSA